MKLKELKTLLETPQTISPIRDHILNDPSENTRVAFGLLAHKKKKIVDTIEDKVFLYEFPTKYAVIDHRDTLPYVLYYVVYTVKYLSFIKRKGISQILVWRKGGVPNIVSGLPARIFFDILLPKYGTILTDYFQTPDGQRFWEDRIGDALIKGKRVYYINFQQKQVIVPIRTEREFDVVRAEAYGNHQKYRQKRLIICEEPLE